jgi:hypothetical protein
MAAAKPEVLESRVLQWIETEFEMLFLCFNVGQADELQSYTRRHRPTPEVQYGGRQTEVLYLTVHNR